MTWFDELGFVAPPRQLARWAFRAKHDLHAALADCDRPDWLLWMLGRCDVDRRTLVGAAARCARAALAAVPEVGRRPTALVDAACAFAAGEIDGLVLGRIVSEHPLRAGPGMPYRAVRSARAAAETAWRADVAHLAARYGERALGGWAVLAPVAAEIRAIPWPARPPPAGLDRCRPALQIAWDLVSEQEVPLHLSTAALLDARRLRATLQSAVHHPSKAERHLLEALTERVALIPHAEALRDQVLTVMRRAG